MTVDCLTMRCTGRSRSSAMKINLVALTEQSILKKIINVSIGIFWFLWTFFLSDENLHTLQVLVTSDNFLVVYLKFLGLRLLDGLVDPSINTLDWLNLWVQRAVYLVWGRKRLLDFFNEVVTRSVVHRSPNPSSNRNDDGKLSQIGPISGNVACRDHLTLSWEVTLRGCFPNASGGDVFSAPLVRSSILLMAVLFRNQTASLWLRWLIWDLEHRRWYHWSLALWRLRLWDLLTELVDWSAVAKVALLVHVWCKWHFVCWP